MESSPSHNVSWYGKSQSTAQYTNQPHTFCTRTSCRFFSTLRYIEHIVSFFFYFDLVVEGSFKKKCFSFSLTGFWLLVSVNSLLWTEYWKNNIMENKDTFITKTFIPFIIAFNIQKCYQWNSEWLHPDQRISFVISYFTAKKMFGNFVCLQIETDKTWLPESQVLGTKRKIFLSSFQKAQGVRV